MRRLTVAAALFAALVFYYGDAPADWSGVDEAVVERIAAEHGREASAPLINTDQGDLLLFVFLVAGAAGGFAGGYCYRMLTEAKRGQKDMRQVSEVGSVSPSPPLEKGDGGEFYGENSIEKISPRPSFPKRGSNLDLPLPNNGAGRREKGQ